LGGLNRFTREIDPSKPVTPVTPKITSIVPPQDRNRTTFHRLPNRKRSGLEFLASTAASLPTARQLLAAAVVNGKIYAISGFNSFSNIVNTVEVYDPSSNSWSTATGVSTPRARLAAASVNGKVYAIGGASPTNILSTMEVYDPNSNSWSTAASLPTTQEDLAAADANGLIYAVGGDNAPIMNATEQYSPPVTIYTFIKN